MSAANGTGLLELIGAPRGLKKKPDVTAADVTKLIEPDVDLGAAVEFDDGARVLLGELGYGAHKDSTWTRGELLGECADDLIASGYDPTSLKLADPSEVIEAWWIARWFAGDVVVDLDPRDPVTRAEMRGRVDEMCRGGALKKTEPDLVARAYRRGRLGDRLAGGSEEDPAARPAASRGDQSKLLDDYGADSSRLRRIWVDLINRGADPFQLHAKSGDEMLAMWNERRADAPPKLASEVLDVERPAITTYTTGFSRLDALLRGGIKTDSVFGVVARTGSGKSGFVIKLGHHVARAHKAPFLYVSSELSEFENAARAVAQELNVPIVDVLDGKIDRASAKAALADINVHVVGTEDMDGAHGQRAIEAIERAIVQLEEKYGVPPVVAVDFLQELAAGDDDPGRVRMGVTSMARALRSLAQRRHVAVIAVSSTGRAFYKPPKEGADDPLSYLGAAKESGDIEFALADMVFLDVASEHIDGTYSARIVVAKARRGSRGFVGARFHGPTGRWEQHDEALDQLTSAARSRASKDTEASKDDAKVLAAITDGAARGEFRSTRQWREILDVPEKRATASIKRLLAVSKVRCTEYHPENGSKKERGGEYVVPAAASTRQSLASESAANPPAHLARLLGHLAGTDRVSGA